MRLAILCRAFHDLDPADAKVVLLINDLNSLYYRRSDEMKYGMAELLRGIIDSGHFLARACSYRDLLPNGPMDFTSPLFNIMTELPLGPFSPEEADMLLTEITALCGDKLSTEECAFIRDFVDLFPFHLQMYGYFLFERQGFFGSHRDGRFEHCSEALERHTQEMLQDFRHLFQNLPRAQRQKVVKAALSEKSPKTHRTRSS